MRRLQGFWENNSFLLSYRLTFKTLVRSPILWVGILLAIGAVLSRAIGLNTGYVIVENNQIVDEILDTDPRYVMSYDAYIGRVLNLRGWTMTWAIPVFCVITSMLVLMRNHNDGFYEVEKAGGVSPASYMLGRMAAIFTVNMLVVGVASYISFDYYYFSRGGVEELTLWEYFVDSRQRVMIQILFARAPAVLLYSAITYCAGSIVKNGIGGTILGLGVVLFNYMGYTTWYRLLPAFYHNYLDPSTLGINNWWAFWNTEWFDEKYIRNQFEMHDMVLAYSILLGISVVCIGLSYILTKIRTK